MPQIPAPQLARDPRKKMKSPMECHIKVEEHYVVAIGRFSVFLCSVNKRLPLQRLPALDYTPFVFTDFD